MTRSKVERALASAAERLRDSSDTLQLIEFADVAASLVQDLVQPVTAIQVAGELVGQQVSNLQVPDGFRRLIGIIDSSGQILAGQLRLVRSFARNRRSDIRAVRLYDLLADTVGLLRPAARERLVQVELAGDGQLPEIRVDPGLMQLGLMSLLNAIVRQLAESSGDGDRRVLVMHRSLDATIQEIGVEFRLPESQSEPANGDERFASCRLVTELHGGTFAVEMPATGIVRCCLRLGADV